MKKYISYEEGSKGKYTEEDMKEFYKSEVDKEEYQDMAEWKTDMLKSGVFEYLHLTETIVWGYTIVTEIPINRYVKNKIKDSLSVGYIHGRVKTNKYVIDWSVK